MCVLATRIGDRSKNNTYLYKYVNHINNSYYGERECEERQMTREMKNRRTTGERRSGRTGARVVMRTRACMYECMCVKRVRMLQGAGGAEQV